MNSPLKMLVLSALFPWICLQISCYSEEHRCKKEDHANLLKLKESLLYSESSFSKLATWDARTSCCSWGGVTCSGGAEVISLDLSYESIVGGLEDSAALAGLSHLQSLNLRNNFFSRGKIPAGIERLSGLRYLNLASTNLSGDIDESITHLSLLTELHLEGNVFRSPIPEFFANFSSIKYLFLGNSFWIGTFPVAIFHLPSLVTLDIEQNQELGGNLPDFDHNSSIQYLILSHTKFGGGIPESLGNLDLHKLDLAYCEFTGEIPHSVFNISSLAYLELTGNNIEGVVQLDWIRNLPNLISLSLSGVSVEINDFSVDQLQFLKLESCNLNKFPVIGNQSNMTSLSLKGNNLKGIIPTLPSSLALLELTGNDFSSTTLEKVFENLNSLMVFDLYDNNLVGEIPSSICNATNLVGFGFRSNSLRGSIPVCLFEKLGSLTTVNVANNRLSGIIPDKFQDDCSIKNLYLNNNLLEGPIPESLGKCRGLETLSLGNNRVSDTFPCQLTHASGLQELNIANNLLHGNISCIGYWPNLRTINLSHNNLTGFTVPPDMVGDLSSLNYLYLQNNSFDGAFPSSVCNAARLKELNLSFNNLHGQIPDCIFENFKMLSILDLSNNQLSGEMPDKFQDNCAMRELYLGDNLLEGPLVRSISNCEGLEKLDIGSNKVSDTFPCHWKHLSNLKFLQLDNNFLHGNIGCMGYWPNLLAMDLSSNNFTGFTVSAGMVGNLSSLLLLNLLDNNLEGTFPESLCNAVQLLMLAIGANKLHGPIPECVFGNMTNLFALDLHSNYFSGEIPNTFQKNCQLQALYMTNNLIEGAIPESLSNCGKLRDLYLNQNKLSSTFPCHLSFLSALDMVQLSNNLLHGDLSCLGDWPNLQILDLSMNQFTGITSFYNAKEMGGLKSLFYLSLASNRLEGTLPSALCTVSSLEDIDFSYNGLHGQIPECYFRNITSLSVLNLRKNNISGSITDKFLPSCRLQSLLLNNNKLEGAIPPSIAKCTVLEVLDLSYNQMTDSFPCQLKNLSSLKVLSLKNNSFHGGIQCSVPGKDWAGLQVMDLSKNHFSGLIPPNWFATWEAILGNINEEGGIGHETAHKTTFIYTYKNHTNYNLTTNNSQYYQNFVTVTAKGTAMWLGRILGIIKTIDFSENRFDGPIPESIGLLSALYALNLSHNRFTGEILSSLGDLSHLESLDLSNNQLTGNVPQQLANLGFLQHLNLSNNKLAGKIPMGTQLQSFPASSYRGNSGLYGPPLTELCSDDEQPVGESCHTPSPSIIQRPKLENVIWLLESAALGFAFGLGLLICPLLFWGRGRMRYNLLTDSIAETLLRCIGK